MRSTISLSATSNPPCTCNERMNRDGGQRIHWFATSVTWTCARSAARNRMSLITPGHASASTQTCGCGMSDSLIGALLVGMETAASLTDPAAVV